VLNIDSVAVGTQQIDRFQMKLSDFNAKQWRVWLILKLVNFVNNVDRQIVFSLFPSIRRDFGPSYVELGYLATAFTVVLSLASFPLGMLADRISRRAVISAGVLFWSGATFFSGLAGSFRALLVARGLVGIGKAAYTPAGAAVISATFPQEVRARVQGAFDAGMFVGGATGIALGGIMAASFGLRFAFFLVGIPAFLALLVSGWFCSFAGYAYVAWGPELVQDYKGFSARQAGLALGLTIVLGGTLGIATGAYLLDLLAKLRSWGRAAIVPIGFVLGAPAIYFSLHASGKFSFLLFFGLGAFFLSWYHGPLTATIHDLVPPRGHATASGFYYLFVNLFSMAIAPVVIGRLADRYNLITALHVPILAQLAGAAFFVVVIHCIRHDGLRHPLLAHHWDDAPCTLAPGVALAFEDTDVGCTIPTHFPGETIE
jgi:MFS family permease